MWRVRSTLRGEPQKKAFTSYFESFFPRNVNWSTLKTFPEVSLVLLTLGARTVF